MLTVYEHNLRYCNKKNSTTRMLKYSRCQEYKYPLRPENQRRCGEPDCRKLISMTPSNLFVPVMYKTLVGIILESETWSTQTLAVRCRPGSGTARSQIAADMVIATSRSRPRHAAFASVSAYIILNTIQPVVLFALCT